MPKLSEQVKESKYLDRAIVLRNRKGWYQVSLQTVCELMEEWDNITQQIRQAVERIQNDNGKVK